MGQKTVLLNEDSHSWGSKLVFLRVSIRFDESADRAGIAIVRVCGRSSSVAREDREWLTEESAAGETAARLRAEDQSEARDRLRESRGDKIRPVRGWRLSLAGDSPKGRGSGPAIENVIRVDLTSAENENAPKI